MHLVSWILPLQLDTPNFLRPPGLKTVLLLGTFNVFLNNIVRMTEL